jgi:hypothetical protein
LIASEFYFHHSRSSYTVPEFAGTIPAVKERPKVTRRPTIPGPTIQQKQPLVKKKAEAKPEKHLALEAGAVADKTPPAEKKVEQKPVQRLYETAPMMPVRKPLVKKKAVARQSVVPTSTGPTMPKKKPLVTKQAKAAAAVKPEQAKAANRVRWAPVAVGIALGSLAPAIYALSALWDPWGLRIVFPFVQLAGLHEFGISHELTRTLPQVMLYLQFPLEGVLVGSNLRRGMKLSAALGPIPGLHFAAGLVLWIVALGSSPPV